MADTFKKKPVTEEEQKIYRVWRRINDAMIAKDRKVLEELYSDDRKFIHMSGKTQTKQEYLDEIMDGTLNYYHTNLRDIDISVHGNDAELSATSYFQAKVYGMYGNFPMRTTARFTKINGQWICTG
ncbi:MAG: nuclear transport factor 2 family protein [Bilifractor sp.]|jgi:ketosteroid isomerase-like protein